MPFCFAYGANMCRSSMALRCPGAEPLGAAKLAGWRFLISLDGYASVARSPRSTVHGVLWKLDEAHLRALDGFEGVARGFYRREVLRVRSGAGSRSAIVYVGRYDRPGIAVSGYMTDVVLPAARDWGLPAAYVAGLERLSAGPKGVAPVQGGF